MYSNVSRMPTATMDVQPIHKTKFCADKSRLQVIQKLIERVSSDRLGFVNAFRGNVYELSTHPYGCRVLQRCFEHLSEEQNRPLLEELHKYTINLMQDQFGVSLLVETTEMDFLIRCNRTTSSSSSWSMASPKTRRLSFRSCGDRCFIWRGINSHPTFARRR